MNILPGACPVYAGLPALVAQHFEWQFPLRGIKDPPPCLHDERLLTLADTIEFFNLILGTQLTADEKTELEAFLRVL